LNDVRPSHRFEPGMGHKNTSCEIVHVHSKPQQRPRPLQQAVGAVPLWQASPAWSIMTRSDCTRNITIGYPVCRDGLRVVDVGTFRAMIRTQPPRSSRIVGCGNNLSTTVGTHSFLLLC